MPAGNIETILQLAYKMYPRKKKWDSFLFVCFFNLAGRKNTAELGKENIFGGL